MDAKKKVFAKPVDWQELYPGRFLHAADLKGKKVTLKMSDVSLEELVGDKGPQVKGLIAFEKTEKQFALNKTNGLLIKAMFGSKLADWVGRRITLFEDTWDGEPCLRVWGSPDIAADMTVTVALPRKRPFDRVLHKVGGPQAVTQAPVEREPGADDDAGEI
jgi:hypothetical protein